MTLPGKMFEAEAPEVEQSVLGCCLLDPQAVLTVCSTLHRRDFTDPGARDIFDLVCAMRAAEEAVNYPSAMAWLKRHGLERSLVALCKLEFALPDTYRVGDGCAQLRALTRRRDSLQAARSFLAQLDQPGTDPDVALDAALADFSRIRFDATAAKVERLRPVLTKAQATDFFKDMDTPREMSEGASWGIKMLDQTTCGMSGGQLLVIGGRPGMGKSVAALKAARATAIGLRKKVLYFSLEMPVRHNLARLVSAEAGVELAKIKHRILNPAERERCRYVFKAYRDSPLLMEDQVTDFEDIQALCELHARAGPLGLVVVDYMQLVTSKRRYDSRQQSLGAFSRGFKKLSLALDIPILCAAQVNRESAKGHRVPELQELREAGDLEQDPDVVVFIHRDEMYGMTPENAGLCQYVVAKQRDGELGTITASFKGEYTEVADLGT